MKKVVVGFLVLVVLYFILDKNTENHKPIVEAYPWQITILADGKTRVFGIILGETLLREVSYNLNSTPKMALFKTNEKLTLEAYYKNISLGGLIGSFIITLDASSEQLNNIKNVSKEKRAENKGVRYDLDKPTADNAASLRVKNLIYIPSAQLTEDIIIKRFGQPTQKIKLKTKEIGWHYLYPEKGLDLIYKEDGKEVLQYVLAKNFNALLEPLQAH